MGKYIPYINTVKSQLNKIKKQQKGKGKDRGKDNG